MNIKRSEIHSTRDTNLIDYLRAFGCFCIVWYHVDYFWSLSENDQELLSSIKYLTISWAMPFFYVTSFYFLLLAGLNNTPKIVIYKKMMRISVILTATVAIYLSFDEFVKILTNSQDYPSDFKSRLSGITLLHVMKALVSGYNTPAYFLAQLAFLYIPIFLIGKAINKYNGTVFLAFSTFMVASIFSKHNALFTQEVYAYLAIAVLLLMLKIYGEKISVPVKRTEVVLLLIVVFCWRLEKGESSIPLILLSILYYGLNTSAKWRKITKEISSFGQKHSLFIFLFHTLVLNIVTYAISKVDNHIGQPYGQIQTFATIVLLSFLICSVISVSTLRKTGWNLRI